MNHENDLTGDTTIPADAAKVTIPVVQEFVRISKRIVETGAVRVRTVTEDVIEQVATERVRHTANVERRSMDIPIDAEYEPHQEGSEWVIPVFEYRPVVTMQLFLTEEIRIGHEVENMPEIVKVPLRRQKVIIERREAESDDWQEIGGKS